MRVVGEVDLGERRAISGDVTRSVWVIPTIGLVAAAALSARA